MKGLEVPARVVTSLGPARRPPVTVTINGHSWRTRVAVLRGRNLIGLSHANRRAAGVEIGDTVTVNIELDVEPRTVTLPTDFAKALQADRVAKSSFERLSPSKQRQLIRTIESAKKPETRARRVEGALTTLRE